MNKEAKKSEKDRNLSDHPPVNLTSGGKRKAQIKEDGFAYEEVEGSWGKLKQGRSKWGMIGEKWGGTRWIMLGSAAGKSEKSEEKYENSKEKHVKSTQQLPRLSKKLQKTSQEAPREPRTSKMLPKTSQTLPKEPPNEGQNR